MIFELNNRLSSHFFLSLNFFVVWTMYAIKSLSENILAELTIRLPP